jgi:hypothetical protein
VKAKAIWLKVCQFIVAALKPSKDWTGAKPQGAQRGDLASAGGHGAVHRV